MSAASSATLVLITAAVSTSITWWVMRDSQSGTEPEQARTSAPTAAVVVAPADPPEEQTKKTATLWKDESKSEKPKPAPATKRPGGISEESWGNAGKFMTWIGNAAEMSGGQEKAREWMAQQVKSVSDQVAAHLKLDDTASAALSDALNQRAEADNLRRETIINRLTDNPQTVQELIALRDMEKRGEITEAQSTRINHLQREFLGEYYPEDEELGPWGVLAFTKPEAPQHWYTNNDAVSAITSQLDETSAASVSDYAERLQYLDRERGAYDASTRIERQVPLEDWQNEALLNLHLDTPKPTREQLGTVLSPDQLNLLDK